MQRIVDAMAEHGADIWYSADPAEFLGEGRDPSQYEQVFDIVDVWFESGSTHSFVLGEDGLNFPADLYLEGSDSIAAGSSLLCLRASEHAAWRP